jgi:hypothetical protein
MLMGNSLKILYGVMSIIQECCFGVTKSINFVQMWHQEGF